MEIIRDAVVRTNFGRYGLENVSNFFTEVVTMIREKRVGGDSVESHGETSWDLW